MQSIKILLIFIFSSPLGRTACQTAGMGGALFLISLLIISCSQKNQTNLSRPDIKDTLMEVDRNFSRYSEENAQDAFLAHAADDLILMCK